MVPCCDAEAGAEIPDDRPKGGLPIERREEGLDEAIDGNTNNECDIEPVDMLVPVPFRDGLVCDVWLLGVVGFAPIGLRLLSHWGWLRAEILGLDSVHASCILM